MLAISIARGDPAERQFIPRSFVTNRAPPFVLYLASSGFVSTGTEDLISQAFSRFDHALVASLTQDSFLDTQSHVLSDARQQFLLACVVHGVIASDSVDRILGEQATHQLPSEGRVSMQQLIDECRGNTQKLDQLVEKTQAFDGNAATRIEALVQVR